MRRSPVRRREAFNAFPLLFGHQLVFSDRARTGPIIEQNRVHAVLRGQRHQLSGVHSRRVIFFTQPTSELFAWVFVVPLKAIIENDVRVSSVSVRHIIKRCFLFSRRDSVQVPILCHIKSCATSNAAVTALRIEASVVENDVLVSARAIACVGRKFRVVGSINAA